MGRLGQDKPAFGWELEPLPLLLYRAVTLCSYIGRDPSSGNTRIVLPCLHTMDAPCWRGVLIPFGSHQPPLSNGLRWARPPLGP